MSEKGLASSHTHRQSDDNADRWSFLSKVDMIRIYIHILKL